MGYQSGRRYGDDRYSTGWDRGDRYRGQRDYRGDDRGSRYGTRGQFGGPELRDARGDRSRVVEDVGRPPRSDHGRSAEVGLQASPEQRGGELARGAGEFPEGRRRGALGVGVPLAHLRQDDGLEERRLAVDEVAIERQVPRLEAVAEELAEAREDDEVLAVVVPRAVRTVRAAGVGYRRPGVIYKKAPLSHLYDSLV